jgi:integrase
MDGANEANRLSGPDGSEAVRSVMAYEPAVALARSDGWYQLPADERRRLAVAACQAHDAAALWRLTEAFVLRTGAAGARVSAHTLRAYRRGVLDLVAAWQQENLLHPAREAGQGWLRALEGAGKTPATVRVRLAAGRTLYAALAHTGATADAPFTSAKPARETTAPWDKRRPYTDDEVAALARAAGPEDRALVLLGAHAGLRVSEALALTFGDIVAGCGPGTDGRAPTGELRVRHGKGGKARTVPLSPTLAAALVAWRDDRVGCGEAGPDTGSDAPVLRYRHQLDARRHLARLARAAGVPYRGVHALRHACGTRLMREKKDLEVVARMLGHSSIETARIYAKWDDTRAAEAVASW